eukprot:2966084-Pleurochrysis_carterae.AAC.2
MVEARSGGNSRTAVVFRMGTSGAGSTHHLYPAWQGQGLAVYRLRATTASVQHGLLLPITVRFYG